MAAKSSKFRERKLSRTNLAGVQAIARRERKKVSEAYKFNLLINEKLRFLKVLKNFTDESYVNFFFISTQPKVCNSTSSH